jgi:hypothetical protein
MKIKYHRNEKAFHIEVMDLFLAFDLWVAEFYFILELLISENMETKISELLV